jgi:hypothetical protein
MAEIAFSGNLNHNEGETNNGGNKIYMQEIT